MVTTLLTLHHTIVLLNYHICVTNLFAGLHFGWADTPSSAGSSANVSEVANDTDVKQGTTKGGAAMSGITNVTDLPGNLSTIHPSNTTPSEAHAALTTGEVIAIVIGVLCGGAAIVIIIICLRKNSGYKKAASAPVTYRKGTNLRTDRAPLTTKDKDPSPPPDGTDDHFYFDDESSRRLQTPNGQKAKRPNRLRNVDQASLDGDLPAARDGGDDDYFYDEIFEPSAFTDEKTKSSIKELSSPKEDDLPDLVFKDDDFDFDDDPFS